jgi:hypothetical protein
MALPLQTSPARGCHDLNSTRSWTQPAHPFPKKLCKKLMLMVKILN